MEELLKAIERYQKDKELTDAALAKVLKVNASTLSRWKSGERKPEKCVSNLFKIPELQLDVINYLRRQ